MPDEKKASVKSIQNWNKNQSTSNNTFFKGKLSVILLPMH